MPDPENLGATAPSPVHPIEHSETGATKLSAETDETNPKCPADPDTAFLAPPLKADEIGRLGHYRVLRKIGAGGMGAVFEAEDTNLGRQAALKVMRGIVAESTVGREKFLREARAAAAVRHDNIVTIYEVGEDRGVHFIALELLHGIALDQWMKIHCKPSISHILRIGGQTAAGLGAAHACGLVHRDIKPANIWLEKPKGRVKILDFGLARQANQEEHLTQEGDVVGTVSYMSPEQARGEKTLDHRTDLFSLGVMLYRMCAGELPFKGTNTTAALLALAMNTPAPVRDKNPDVPEELAELIHQLLNKDRSGRPNSAEEVAKQLRAIEKSLTSPTAIKQDGLMVVPASVAGPDLAFDFSTDPENPPPGSSATGALPNIQSRRRFPWQLVSGAVMLAALTAVAAWLMLKGKKGPASAPESPAITKAAPTPPKMADLERKGAKALHQFADLEVRVASTDKFIHIRPNEQLPAEPFEVRAIEFWPEYEQTPPGFVPNILLPALRNLKTLRQLQVKYIHGSPLSVANFQLSESDLMEIVSLPLASTLESLDNTFFLTSKALETLKRLPKLRRLTCDFSQVDDDLLARLRELPALRDIHIFYITQAAKVTIKGIAVFSKLPLTALRLRIRNDLQVEMARVIGQMPGLTRLEPVAANDVFFDELGNCPKLQRLQLDESSLSDAGLGRLQKFPALKELALENPTLTDASLDQVAKLRNLTSLEINISRESPITVQGIDKLSDALPKCRIKWKGGEIEPKR